MAVDYRIGGLPHQAFDISPNGDWLYLAVLDGSINPQILLMSSALDVDAVTQYDPTTGDSINVVCGDYKDIVWAAGNLGTYKVAHSDNIEGNYWYTKDSGVWAGAAQPILLNASDDEIIIIALDGADDLLENYFINEDLYWTAHNVELPYDVGAMAQWAYNLDELLIGIDEAVYWYVDDNIVDFSPNRGKLFASVSTGLENAKITSLIVG